MNVLIIFQLIVLRYFQKNTKITKIFYLYQIIYILEYKFKNYSNILC